MPVSFLLKVFKVPPWLSGSHLHGMTGEALRDLASAGHCLLFPLTVPWVSLWAFAQALPHLGSPLPQHPPG